MAPARSPPSVALFRAREDAVRSAAALSARGVAGAIAPVIAFHRLNAPQPAGPFDFAVAASPRAIDFAPPAALAIARGLPLYVVGERTAQAARRAGLVPLDPVAENVAALLPALPPGRALHLAGRDRKSDLEAALGERAETMVVYEARARSGWDESEARAVAGAAAALHYSERSAALAVQFAEEAGLRAVFRLIAHVCLSREVAAPLAASGMTRALWPRRAAEADLFDTLESALADYGAL